MRLRSLSLSRISIPFHKPFRHAGAVRSETESLWVEAADQNGLTGYGEACPRSYVSGEDLPSARAFFERWRPELLASIGSLSDLEAWIRNHRPEIDAQPAAWCAIELALLDLLAKNADVPVEALLGLKPATGPFQYSAVLGHSEGPVFQKQLEQYLAMGFKDFKLKLSGDPERDRPRIRHLLNAGVRVRVDANNLWPDPQSALAHLAGLGQVLFAIEEPLGPAGRYEDLANLGRSLGTPVILDESCLRLAQLERLRPACPWIVNLRISKMGGLLRSLELARAAGMRGLPLIVGAQVGETSLLTRAALTIAANFPQRLVAQEGAFGTHLLKQDIVAEPLMFGRGGQLRLESPHAPGFGLEISQTDGLILPLDTASQA